MYLASLLNCTFVYDSIDGTDVSGTGLVLGGFTGSDSAIETYVADCVFQGVPNYSPTGSIAIQILSVEHVRVTNTRIEEFAQSIVIAPSGSHRVKKLYFGNVSAFSGTNQDSTTVGAAVLIQPTNGSSVEEVWFDCCEFDGPDNHMNYQGGGVVIDAVNGEGGGGLIDQVRLVGCHVCKWWGPGLLVIGGTISGASTPTNIEVLGGFYSLNGADPLSGLPSAGIAVTGTPSGIQIVGPTCNNTLYHDGSLLSPTQDYGISIASGAQNVFVRNCDLNGNLTQAVAPISSVTNVQITDSAGYNDQGTPVRTTPPGLTPFNGITFNYYGPVEFYTTGGGLLQIAIDGHNTNLTAGSFFLKPLETAQLSYSGVPSFLMIGK